MAVVDELILRISIKNEAKGLKDLASDLKSLSSSGSSLFSGLSSAAESATSAVVNFGKQAVTKLADFRAEMASVGKTTGLTGVALDQLGKSLRNMSISDLGGAVAAEELAQIAAAAGQLGVKGKDIEAFTLSVAEISKATDIAADRTAEDMAKIANQFRESLEKPRIYFDEFGNSLGETSKSAYQQLSNIGSAINELSNNTTASAAQLVDMTKRMAGMGASVGLTVDNVAALSATMVDAGLGVERGSTAMNKMIGELYKNTDAFADALNLNAQDLADALSKDPMKAIEMVLQGMDKMKQQEGPKALLLAVEELLGKGDGITQLALNLSSKYADLGKNTLMAADAFAKGTSAHDEFLAQTAHTAARWDALKEKVNEFSRRIGEVLEPMTNWVTGILNSLADMVLGNFDKMAGYAQGKIELIKGFFSDVFGPEVVASLASGDIISAFEGLIVQVQSLFAESPFAGLLESAQTTATGVIEVFNSLIDGVWAIIGNLAAGDYEAAFSSLVQGVRSVIGKVVTLFLSLADNAKALMLNFAAQFEGTPLEPFVREIAILFGNVVDIIKTLVQTGYELFQSVFTPAVIEGTIGVLVAMLGTAAQGINVMIDGFKQLGTFIGGWIAGEYSFGEIFAGLGSLLWEALTSAFAGLVGWFGDQFSEVGSIVKDVFSGVGDWIKDLFGKLVDVILQPIREAKQKIEEAVHSETLVGFFEGLTDKIYGVEAAENALTTAVEGTNAAVNQFGVDAVYQSVFPDVQAAVASTTEEVDLLDGALVAVKDGVLIVGNSADQAFQQMARAAKEAGNAAGEAAAEIEAASAAADKLITKEYAPVPMKEMKAATVASAATAAQKGYTSATPGEQQEFRSMYADLNALMDKQKELYGQSYSSPDSQQVSSVPIAKLAKGIYANTPYLGIEDDMRKGIGENTKEIEKLGYSIEKANKALNQFGDDAVYHSVFPDTAKAAGESSWAIDEMTQSLIGSTDAVGKLGEQTRQASGLAELMARTFGATTIQSEPMGLNTSNLSRFQDLLDRAQAEKSAAAAAAKTMVASSANSRLSVSDGAFSRNLGQRIVASESGGSSRNTERAVYAQAGQSVSINFSGPNIMDESSKNRFVREMVTTANKLNLNTIRG